MRLWLARRPTAEGPKALEIGVLPIGDEARPFDLIVLPSLKLRLDADDREVGNGRNGTGEAGNFTLPGGWSLA